MRFNASMESVGDANGIDLDEANCFSLYNNSYSIVDKREKWELPNDVLVSIDQSSKLYDFNDIEAATENFSNKYKMGASVYRGVLQGELLAIEQMSKDVDKDTCLLQRISHFNLISLHGACENSGVFYLVYEFMENGSLREWLQNKS
ncbi:hypothetical protein V6N13_052549 [Hibiscus sabdariffa]